MTIPKNSNPPRDEWDRPPWNRWSFQHVREILPTTEVWRGSGEIWNLPTVPLDLGPLKFNYDHQPMTVDAWLESSFTDGVAILHRGTLVFERYYNHMHHRSLHLSQSVAKSVTGVVAGVLVDRDLLDPEEDIIAYLPELDRTGWKDAKLRHTLDMTSGVRYVEDYDSPDSDVALTDVAAGWKSSRPELKAPHCVWDQILTLEETVRQHGELFQYRSIETDLLGHCMQRVTGLQLAELISRELWQPLGCEESANFTVDPAGYAVASGGLSATLRDYARFGQTLVNGGIGNGKQLVPIEWIKDTLNANPALFGPPANHTLPNGAYRNQFWIRDANRRVIMARGIFGQLIYIDMDHDLVVVKLSTWPESLSTPRRLIELTAIDAICSHLIGEIHG